jgi:hypothetical protein
MKRLFNTAFYDRYDSISPVIYDQLTSLGTQPFSEQLKIIRNLSFLITDIQKRAQVYQAGGMRILLSLLRNTQNRDLSKAILAVVDRLLQEDGSSEQLLK